MVAYAELYGEGFRLCGTFAAQFKLGFSEQRHGTPLIKYGKANAG